MRWFNKFGLLPNRRNTIKCVVFLANQMLMQLLQRGNNNSSRALVRFYNIHSHHGALLHRKLDFEFSSQRRPGAVAGAQGGEVAGLPAALYWVRCSPTRVLKRQLWYEVLAIFIWCWWNEMRTSIFLQPINNNPTGYWTPSHDPVPGYSVIEYFRPCWFLQ